MAKVRIVVDTNVYVSGLLWTGLPHDLLSAAETGHLTLVTTPAIIEEVREVLVRPKFAARIRTLTTSVDELLESLLGIVQIIQHALTQEVAYNSVLHERRKVLHEQTARAIEDLYSANLDEHYSELAHHYSRSGNTQKAVEYLQVAGQQAIQHSANIEAVTHVTTASELLKSLPDTPERNQRELTLQLTLGVALMSTKGWSASEVERVYSRARELCQHVREDGQIFWALMGLWVFHLIRSDLRGASSLGDQILNLAQHLSDDALLIPGHYTQAWSLFALGESYTAQEHWERVIAQYHPEDHRIYVNLYSVDFGVGARVCAAFAFWCLGYPDQAVRIIHDACTLARQVMHSFSLAFALEVAAIIHQLRYERQEAKELAEAAVALSTERGFPVELAMASIPCSWTFILRGQGKEELIQIKRDLATLHSLGAGIWRPYFLALLAEGHRESEQAEEGLAVLAEAIATVESTGERWYEAELYRLKGELTLQLETRGWRLETGSISPQAPSLKPLVSLTMAQEAERYFLKAIDIARKQQAKSLELRAVMSLVRLRQHQATQAELRITYHAPRSVKLTRCYL